MRLTDASVAIRPRSAWEALDLGILLAHRHARLLMGSWALLTLPLFAVLSLLLWQHPTLAILIFWWLKPAFERLPLYILSHALFGDTPTLRQALRAYPALLRKQLPASLLWRRFSPTRSFDLPVLQLEGLAGEPRSQRLIVLSQRNAGGATWLTVVGVHLEMALWAGFAMLLYLLIPAQNEIDWNWQSLLDPEAGEWLWLEHLSNLLYVLVLVVWEPIYVACGFTLYLNRRTELEAWDIELVFRRLRQRLVGSAYVLLLGLTASLAWLPAPSAYAEPAAATSAGEAELPPEQARFHIGCAPGGDSPGVKYRPWENVNRGDITDIYGDSIDDRERWRVTNRRGISGFTGRRHHRKRIRNYSPSGHYDPEALRYAAVKIGIRRRFGR